MLLVLLLVLIFAVIVLICAVTLSGRRHGNTDVSIPENISDVTAATAGGGESLFCTGRSMENCF